MDNRRTETARENDDRDIIDSTEPTPRFSGSSGGNLQEDIASRTELERVRNAEAHEGVEKQDKIDHEQEISKNRSPDKRPGGGSE